MVVVAGIVIALFGWDRYRGNRNAASNGSASQPTTEVFIDTETADGCACGTTRRQGSGNSARRIGRGL